jgi:hypothetical protein
MSNATRICQAEAWIQYHRLLCTREHPIPTSLVDDLDNEELRNEQLARMVRESKEAKKKKEERRY